MATSDAPEEPAGAKLRAAITSFADEAFAVVDGGQFDDLPVSLKGVGLPARSLFLDHADPEIERAGPWLVPIEPGSADRLLALVGDLPAAVFWRCGGGEAALHHHLRTLNLARIPRWALDGASGPATDADADRFGSAMFRHWDPRVLGLALPLFDAAQFARLLGPAHELVFVTEDGRVRRAVFDEDWPPPPPGMLTIRSDQMEAIAGGRLDASRRRVANYLRKVAPEETAGLDDDALLKRVRDYEAEGADLGLRSEAAHGRWALLMTVTGGEVAKGPPVRKALREAPGGDSDAALAGVLDEMVRLEAGGAPHAAPRRRPL